MLGRRNSVSSGGSVGMDLFASLFTIFVILVGLSATLLGGFRISEDELFLRIDYDLTRPEFFWFEINGNSDNRVYLPNFEISDSTHSSFAEGNATSNKKGTVIVRGIKLGESELVIGYTEETKLMAELSGGAVISGKIDIYYPLQKLTQVSLDSKIISYELKDIISSKESVLDKYKISIRSAAYADDD